MGCLLTGAAGQRAEIGNAGALLLIEVKFEAKSGGLYDYYANLL